MDKKIKQRSSNIKAISYVEYMSPSENYFVMIANMNMKLYDARQKKLKKIEDKYVHKICITKDDRYLIYSKTSSGTLTIYDLENNCVKKKKILKREAEIEFIIQLDKNQVLIGLVDCKKYIYYNGLYNFKYSIYLYDFEENSYSVYVLDDYLEIDGQPVKFNDFVYIPCRDLNHKKTWISFYNKKINKVKDFVQILDNYSNVEISKKGRYMACRYKNHIDLYDIETKEIIQIMKNPELTGKFENELLRKECRGHFGINTNKQEVYYLIFENRIDIYNLENHQRESIIVDCESYIMDALISFKNSYLCLRILNITKCYCYLYDL